jgi:predicted TPR repeat methyltransferase
MDAIEHNKRGFAHAAANRLDLAVESFRAATLANPLWDEAFNNLGMALWNFGKKEESIAAFRRAVELNPQSDVFKGNLQAAEFHLGIGKSMPPALVSIMFNEIASTFERHVVGKLEYAGHTLIDSAVREVCTRDDLAILDIGCGTGLCGALLKNKAKLLVGVDMASAMIAESKKRGIYDELFVGDFREMSETRYDLVVAGDVFIYVGDLDRSFAAISALLRDNGMLAFTVENDQGDGFTLRPSQRFAHSESYVRSMAGKYGFAVEYRKSARLRMEGTEWIAGSVYVLRKAGVS